VFFEQFIKVFFGWQNTGILGSKSNRLKLTIFGLCGELCGELCAVGGAGYQR